METKTFDLMKWMMGMAIIALLLVNTVYAGSTNLYLGCRGDAVKEVQTQLKTLNYFTYSNCTGYFGAITKQAVLAFQQDKGLVADGVVGPKTKSTLDKLAPVKSDDTTGNTDENTNTDNGDTDTDTPPANAPTLSDSLVKGDSGSQVKTIQLRLKALKYPVTTDGVFGNGTLLAVTTFQSKAGITVSPKVTQKFVNTLFASTAPKYKSSSAITQLDPAAIIALANKQLGKPYVFGAEGPDKFDCSGLAYYVFDYFGVRLPRTAYLIGYTYDANRISRKDLTKGDFVMFDTIGDDDLCDHMGIYIGNNKFLHASSSKTNGMKVRIDSLSEGFYNSAFVWGIDMVD